MAIERLRRSGKGEEEWMDDWRGEREVLLKEILQCKGRIQVRGGQIIFVVETFTVY